MFRNYPYMEAAEIDAGGGAEGGGDEAAAAAAAAESGDEGAGEQGAGESGGEGEAKGYWPDDWRNNIAGEDEKLLGRLGRYASPKEVSNALIAAQNKISSGEMRPTLGESASEEEIASYRKDMGIPEDSKGYELDLGEGFVVGEDDKPMIDSFLESAHASNQTPDQVNATLNTYYKLQAEENQVRAEEDVQAQSDGEDTMRAEWGGEFRRNINLVHNMLDGKMDEDTKELFLSGRLADGTPIGSSPAILSALLNTALENNPSATITPSAGGSLGETIDSEIATIQEKMRTDRKAYNKDEKLQARFRQLLEARDSKK